LTRERLGACAMIVDNIQLKGRTDAISKKNDKDERKKKTRETRYYRGRAGPSAMKKFVNRNRIIGNQQRETLSV